MKEHPLKIYLKDKQSIRSFCKSHGLSYPTVIGLIHGARLPSFKMIARICNASGGKIRADDLFSWHWQTMK